jgi:Flp pilus assembly protein TadB
MKPLLLFVDRHTASSGVIGVVSGFVSWLIAALHFAAGVAADLAILFSFACTVLTFLLLLRKYRHNAAQRRQARAQDLDLDDHLS